MLTITVRNTNQVVKSLERELDSVMTRVANDTLGVARSKTPIDQGRARRGWRMEKSYRLINIVNRVPYIDELERGRSKQAPSGILGPTVREISRRRY